MNTNQVALLIPKFFLASAGIAALNCYARADYNLPLFVFAYLAWTTQKAQKLRVSWLIAVTLFVDIIWALYWPSLWHSEKFEDGYWENGVHDMVIILSIFNLVFKVVILGAIHQNEPDVKKAFTVDGVKASIAYLTQFR